MSPTLALSSVQYMLDLIGKHVQEVANSDEVRGALMHLDEAKNLLGLELHKLETTVAVGVQSAEGTLQAETTTAPEVPVSETSPAVAAPAMPEAPVAPAEGSPEAALAAAQPVAQPQPLVTHIPVSAVESAPQAPQA